MKILDTDEKKVYDEFINMIQFENIDCWDIQAPEEWLNNIKDLKINEDLKWLIYLILNMDGGTLKCS
mgnify:CR=1 FL=1